MTVEATQSILRVEGEQSILRVEGEQSILRVEGELDLGTAGLLDQVLSKELSAGRRFVRLDLSRLTFIDCAALGVLVRAHNQFLAARGSLVLTRLSPPVTRLLAITCLDEALFLADDASARPASPHMSAVHTSTTAPASDEKAEQ